MSTTTTTTTTTKATTTTSSSSSWNYSLNNEWDIDKEENDVYESSQQLIDFVDTNAFKSLRDFVQQCEEVLQRSERHGHNQSIRRSSDTATKHHHHHQQQQSRRLLHRLIVTSALGLVECVQWLLECGADPTVSLAYGREQWTALHYAAATRQVHALAVLLTATPGSTLTIDTLRDNSPLHYTPLDLLSIDLQQTPCRVCCPVCIPHQVWSWGSGSEWLLGHGDPLDRPSPKRIKALEDEHVISLTTTSRYCAALTASGTFNHTTPLHSPKH
jgi:hypothetical protein